MKKLLSLLTVLTLVLTLASCGGTAETTESTDDAASTSGSPLHGYIVEGNTIKFIFDSALYPSFDEVETVTIAGEMNGWDPAAADWQATDDDGDGVWTFESTLDEAPVGSAFKFVTNEVDWQQPNADKLDEMYLKDDGFGGFNIVIVE